MEKNWKAEKGRELRNRYEFRECLLEKEDQFLIDWLPGRFARPGMRVCGEDNGYITAGWTVIRVYPKRPYPNKGFDLV